MVNYKAYKIISKTEQPVFDFVLFELENYVDCGEYRGRQITGKGCIACKHCHPYTSYQKGDWLEIDLDRIGKKEDTSLIFDDTSIVRKVGSSSSTNIITSRGSSSDVVISPSVVNTMGSSQTMELARYMSRMVDENDKEYELKIEDNSNTRFTYSLICRKQK